MTLKQLEAEVLALPKDSLVALLARLLEHLSQLSEIHQDVEPVWTQEAEARDREIDDDPNFLTFYSIACLKTTKFGFWH